MIQDDPDNNNNINNHNHNQINHKKPMKFHRFLSPEISTATKPSSSSSLHYWDHLLRFTKASLTLCFILSISLVAFAAFSSTTTTSSVTTAARFFSLSSNSPSPSFLPGCRPNFSDPKPTPTRPDHIVFSLSGSAATWPDRRKYSQLWWSNLTRGFVWLDQDPNPSQKPELSSGPEYRVSSGSPKWVRKSSKPSDRIARILKESFEMGLPEVRWFVMGDDDTVFFPANLAAVLSKYDHRRLFFVGGNSESVEQDVMHGYETAFGGGGFAVSYPLACELVGILDACIERYHNYYGSDEKVSACTSELGVPLTREPGFHQLDVRGDPYGLLAAHPLAPLVSLHHLDSVKPLFPGQTQLDSLKKLMQSYRVDPGLTVQQSFCYDHKRKWSVSIAWGYTAQLYPSLVSSRVLSTPLQTFRTWRSYSEGPFVFNTRPLKDDPCERPIMYYLDQVQDVGEGKTLSIYKRVATTEVGDKCKQIAYKYATSVEKFTVTATKTSPDHWLKAPRRQCCEITNSWSVTSNMKVNIRSCKPREAMSI